MKRAHYGGQTRLRVFLVLFWLIALPVFADLSGAVKYSLENSYTDADLVQNIFTQDYLTNLRGALLEDRIGNYQLGLQYRRGAAELKNVSFSDTLNFRDYLHITTSFLRRDVSGVQYYLDPIADNRYAITANLAIPNFPIFLLGYETGDSKSASVEGVNKLDKSASAGLNYTFGGNNLSARYVRKVLYDETALSSIGRVTNRNNLFSLDGTGQLGELVQVSGSYSKQELFNQISASSNYNQKQERLVASSRILLLPFLALNPEYDNFRENTDYLAPSAESSYRYARKTAVEARFSPLRELEFIAGGSLGDVEFLDAGSLNKQDLAGQKAGLTFQPWERWLANVFYSRDYYSGAGGEGRITSLSGLAALPLRKNIKLTYKKNYSNSAGLVATASAVNLGKRDLDDWFLDVTLADNWVVEGEYAMTYVNTFNYRKIGGGVRYSPELGVFELRREYTLGVEGAQNSSNLTDSLKVLFNAGNLIINEQIFLYKNIISSPDTSQNVNGFRYYTDVKYELGESSLNVNYNSERREDGASVNSKLYLSFTRNF
ncbi:hypothetical protein HZB07_04980 [Candidatus Saganbacteria bacterium]|nr:hypothetical protein [Candidatus Saganbacteria bacterium]